MAVYWMKPCIIPLFLLVTGILSSEALSAAQSTGSASQLNSEALNTYSKLAGPTDNICIKVYVTVGLLVGILFTSSFVFSIILITFYSEVGAPIGLGLIYLLYRVFRSLFKLVYKRIDKRWNRDDS